MNLIPQDLRDRLLANGQRSATDDQHDPVPVLKLHVPGSGMAWLLTELDPDDPDVAYGLCDLGVGTPALDHVRLSALSRLAGDAIARDDGFLPEHPLSVYLQQAKALGRIDA